MSELMSNQIKSRKRVVERGEVFTNEREVKAMLDLVKNESERIESRFLEPACGNGNFIAEVLRRKLSVVKNRYSRNIFEYEKYAFVAIASIYGVDIMPDNVEEAKRRLFEILKREYCSLFKINGTNDFLDSIQYVLNRNILCGDALTMLQPDGNPIIFSEWSIVLNDKVKRRDFRFDELLEGNTNQISLFQAAAGWEYDDEVEAFIPSAINEYPLMPFKLVKQIG